MISPGDSPAPISAAVHRRQEHDPRASKTLAADEHRRTGRPPLTTAPPWRSRSLRVVDRRARRSSGASVRRLDSATFAQRAKARVPVPRRRLRGRAVGVLTGADRYGGIGLSTGRRGPRDAGGRAGDDVQAVVARWRRSPRRRRSRRAVREGRPQAGPRFVGERDVRGASRVYGLRRCPCRRCLRGGAGGLLRRAAMSRSP
jgi:hypothetical protein